MPDVYLFHMEQDAIADKILYNKVLENDPKANDTGKLLRGPLRHTGRLICDIADNKTRVTKPERERGVYSNEDLTLLGSLRMEQAYASWVSFFEDTVPKDKNSYTRITDPVVLYKSGKEFILHQNEGRAAEEEETALIRETSGRRLGTSKPTPNPTTIPTPASESLTRIVSERVPGHDEGCSSASNQKKIKTARERLINELTTRAERNKLWAERKVKAEAEEEADRKKEEESEEGETDSRSIQS